MTLSELREACAKVCDSLANCEENTEGHRNGAAWCAERIRALPMPEAKPCLNPYCECEQGTCKQAGRYNTGGTTPEAKPEHWPDWSQEDKDRFTAALGKMFGWETPSEAKPALEPFMFGIANPDGKAHLDDWCVSTDAEQLSGAVDSLNDAGEGTYRAVPLYTLPPDAAAIIKELTEQRDALFIELISLRGACAADGWLTEPSKIQHMDSSRDLITSLKGRR